MKKVISLVLSVLLIFLLANKIYAADDDYDIIFPSEVNALSGTETKVPYKVSVPASFTGYYVVEWEFTTLPKEIENTDVGYDKIKETTYFSFIFKEETQAGDYDIGIRSIGSLNGEIKAYKYHKITVHLGTSPFLKPPILIVVQPPCYINENPLRIIGIVKFQESLYVNEKLVKPYDDHTFICYLHLNEGGNIIEVKATNKYGFSSEEEFCVTLDTQAPMLAVQEIPKVAKEALVIIKGITTADYLFINQYPIFIDKNGNFIVYHPLAKGLNNIEIKAMDKAGNVEKFETQVNYTGK